MNGIVSRTCTEIPLGEENRNREKNTRPLKDFRSESAYVLLGDPGAGKTTAFVSECRALGNCACLVDARDFIALDLNSHPEWREKTLFVDGLDEVRAGSFDVRTPFDEIRRRLDGLGRPRFRLSCRTADWLGGNDRRHLQSVFPEAGVTVLQLDPLSERQVVEILTALQDIDDPDDFVRKARERGVYGLLENPQTLNMLAEVVRGGRGWPDSRKETFEMACRQMVQEHNDEHQAVSEPEGPPPPDQLLDVAGRLCAIQLLSGAAGFSLRSNEASEDFPTLDRFDRDSLELLRRAVGTKLFKGAPVDRFVPIHRHIAEFLGARHLTRLIETGLLTRRILSLIGGDDGIVVTEMRGLSAWLAAHCSESRAALIDRDPIGVGQYGDVSEFSIDEKRALLRALCREASRLGRIWRLADACRALATPETEPEFRQILETDDRSDEQQEFTYFVLCVLTLGAPISDLSDKLLEIARDDTYRSSINVLAIDAFVRSYPGQDLSNKLRSLLTDVQSGNKSDPDNEILGVLLTNLYPREVSASEVWKFFPANWNPDLIGSDSQFWCRDLIRKSSDADVAQLLDSFKERCKDLWPALELRYWTDVPVKLLVRGLNAHGERLSTKTLYDWLYIGCSWDGFDQESIQEIRLWLEQHPAVQKAVIVEGIDRWEPEAGEFRAHAREVDRCLYGATRPADFGRWCLDQAVSKANTSWRVSEYLFERAFRALRDQNLNEGLSLELLRKRAREHERLTDSLSRLRAPLSNPRIRLDAERRHQDILEKHRRQKKEWLDHVRSQESALRENRATPVLLHQMALKYLQLEFAGRDGKDAIAELLQGDQSLIDATLQGLRSTVDRGDVPDVARILALRRKHREHFLVRPYLAGLAEIENIAPVDVSKWDDSRVRKATAFYYCTFHGEYRPEWYLMLLENFPETVADVYVQFAVAEFRRGTEIFPKTRELAHDPRHRWVAQHATLRVLRAFPIRCKVKHLWGLDQLIWAAIQHADRALLRELIDRKLSLKSMNVAQRVHWLAAGTTISPGAHKDSLEDFVKDRERRLSHLVEFYWFDGPDQFSFGELEISVVELLIRLVGSSVSPNESAEMDGVIIPAPNSLGFVNRFIQFLASSSDRCTGNSLDTLVYDPELSDWRTVLSRARDAQRVIWRDARYRHPSIEQVCRTLNGGSPANAADLAALVVDWLNEIGKQIRTGNTDDWRQYWNEVRGRICSPRHENFCRDAILSDLRLRLQPQGVDAQREGQYARDTRADIRVSCRDFHVPVEIKKNSHPNLWRACRTQLIEQYTRDPATDGYGIYLVFWFGPRLTQRSPYGRRPANPKELRERLEKTLSNDERRKISIKVIDVSGDL